MVNATGGVHIVCGHRRRGWSRVKRMVQSEQRKQAATVRAKTGGARAQRVEKAVKSVWKAGGFHELSQLAGLNRRRFEGRNETLHIPQHLWKGAQPRPHLRIECDSTRVMWVKQQALSILALCTWNCRLIVQKHDHEGKCGHQEHTNSCLFQGRRMRIRDAE